MSYQSFESYYDEEDADLGNFARTGSLLTSCRVGSYSDPGSPPVKSDCNLGDVCQITFEYRKMGSANFKRFYRATCKGKKQCEVSLNFMINRTLWPF